MAFDRIKTPEQRLIEREARRGEAPADAAGRAALFSSDEPRASGSMLQGVAVHCSRCGQSSTLDARSTLRAVLPLVLVAPWKDHPVFAVCPAGGHRAWLRPTRAQ